MRLLREVLDGILSFFRKDSLLHHESRGLPWLDVLKQDLQFTQRTLKGDYGFTSIAVLILALGIAVISQSSVS